MSDTYSRINEAKQRYGLMQRTQIYADFIHIVNLNSKLTHNRFLYVCTPLDINDANEDWAGTLSMLKKTINRNHDRLEETVLSETRSMKRDIGNL